MRDSALVLLIVYVNSSKIASRLASVSPGRFRFTGKAAAKVRTFSINFQIFSKLFSKFFFREKPGPARPAKWGNLHRNTPEVSQYQSVSLSISTASFLKAGAKVEPLREPAKYYDRFFGGNMKVFSSRTDL